MTIDYIDKAKKLVDMAKIVAVGSIVPLLDKVPELEKVVPPANFKNWDFFVAAASVWAAYIRIDMDVPANQQNIVKETVLQHLDQWNPQGLDVFKDLAKFMQQSEHQIEKVEDSESLVVALRTLVGTWLLWNLKQSRPTPEEGRLAGILGAMYFDNFRDYWKS